MDVFCSACESIFAAAWEVANDDKEAGPFVGAFLPLEQWMSHALSSSCHLCAILFHSNTDKHILRRDLPPNYGQEDITFTLWKVTSSEVSLLVKVPNPELPLTKFHPFEAVIHISPVSGGTIPVILCTRLHT